jgi:hypothetical protein
MIVFQVFEQCNVMCCYGVSEQHAASSFRVAESVQVGGEVCRLYRKVCRILAKALEIFLYSQHIFSFLIISEPHSTTFNHHEVVGST